MPEAWPSACGRARVEHVHDLLRRGAMHNGYTRVHDNVHIYIYIMQNNLRLSTPCCCAQAAACKRVVHVCCVCTSRLRAHVLGLTRGPFHDRALSAARVPPQSIHYNQCTASVRHVCTYIRMCTTPPCGKNVRRLLPNLKPVPFLDFLAKSLVKCQVGWVLSWMGAVPPTRLQCTRSPND